MGLYWLWFLLIGLAAGWLAGLIVKGEGSGLLLNLIIGVVGSVLGGWIFGLFGLSAGNMWGSLLMAMAGAVVLLLIFSLFRKKDI